MFEKRFKKWLAMGAGAVVFMAAGVGLTLWLNRLSQPPVAQESSIVPAGIRRSVPFSVYYPDPAQLPAGYKLDTNSFSSGKQAVLYTITYGNHEHVIFTVQARPSDADLKTFYANHIPLRNEYAASVGQIAIGVLNERTFGSLPAAEGGAWVLATAPLTINSVDFEQIMKALRRS